MDIYENFPDAFTDPDYRTAAMDLRSQHDDWWAAWVAPRVDLKPAIVRIQVGEVGHAFYDHDGDVIRLFMANGDPEELAERALLAAQMHFIGGTCSRARITWHLLHEMMHEYERKVLNMAATPAGEALYRQLSPSRFGPGHDASFYSAIAINAAHFGMSPESFEAEL